MARMDAMLEYSPHLARYRVADLALDTFPYTSHTTASDALWEECLLVSLCGETFAARVSGGLLTACNLPELTYTLADYERLALRRVPPMSRSGPRCGRGTRASKQLAPLFDAATFTRDLERLYREVAGESWVKSGL